jgi:hypothetical protein
MAENENENTEPKKKGRPRSDAKANTVSNEEGTTSTGSEEPNTQNINTSTSKEEDDFVRAIREEIDKDMGIGSASNGTTTDDTNTNDAQNTSNEGGGGNDGGGNTPPESGEATEGSGEPTNNNNNVNTPPLDFDPDPLDDVVIERGYSQTKGNVSEEQIPEPKVSQQQAFNPNEKKNDKKTTGNSAATGTTSSRMENMSPSQKRKAAEATADALLTTYQQCVPPIFKSLTSFNIDKLERMEMKDEINLSLPILEDGTVVRDYVERVNVEVDSLFTVTDEMKEAIREPLVDVLLEKEVAMTPTERLILAVGTQMVGFTVQAIKNGISNKNAMDTFKEFHKKSKEDRDIILSNTHKTTTQSGDTSYTPPPNNETRPPKKNNPPPPPPSNDDDDEDIPTKKTKTPPTPQSSNDKLNVDDVLTVENGGITVEEF